MMMVMMMTTDCRVGRTKSMCHCAFATNKRFVPVFLLLFRPRLNSFK